MTASHLRHLGGGTQGGLSPLELQRHSRRALQQDLFRVIAFHLRHVGGGTQIVSSRMAMTFRGSNRTQQGKGRSDSDQRGAGIRPDWDTENPS